MSPRVLAVLLVGVLAISWASLLVRWCTLPPLAIAAWRLILATALVTAASPRPTRPPDRKHAILGALAGVCLALHFATWISSLAYLPVSVSVVLVTTSPIFTALLARLVLKEKLRTAQIAGMLLAALGSAGMTPLSDATVAWKGCLLALTGAVAVACYFVLGKRCSHPNWPWQSYLIWVYGWAALTLTITCFSNNVALAGYSNANWGWLLLLGLVPQGIGHSALNWALRHAGSAQVSVAVLGEPIGATILAWIFLGEGVGGREAICAGLILGGVALTLSPPGDLPSVA